MTDASTNIKPSITIIIPFLNEKENIPHLVGALNHHFGQDCGFDTKLIFVDDGSTDGSYDLITEQLQTCNVPSKALKLSKNVGSHAALRAGIANAKTDYITFMYADLQDPLEVVQQQFEKIHKQNDIVWAHRASTQSKLKESFFSKWYASLMKKYVSKSFPKNGFDIVMFNQKVAEQLNLNQEKNSSIFLQILIMGFKQASIYYNKQERKRGKSKWTWKKKMKLFIDSFIGFSYFPIRVVTYTGIGFSILGLLWTLYIILRKIILNDLQTGWPALISILMIGFGITNLGLGIIAEYLWRTLDQTKKRPVYIIDEVFENMVD